MIGNPHKLCFNLVLIAAMLVINTRTSAHIISIDNVLNLVADRDHASGELMAPVEAMLMWSAALAGRTTPDKTNDPLAYAKAQADKVVQGIELTYGDIEMEAKVTGTSLRTVDLGLTEDQTPQQMAVYKIEFTPKRRIVAPPTEVSFGHALLAVPEQFQQQDITVMCFVHFRQADSTTVKNEAVAADERVTFKCKWPARPASAPAPASVAPTTPTAAKVMQASQAFSVLPYVLAASIAACVAGAVGLGAIFMKRRA